MQLTRNWRGRGFNVGWFYDEHHKTDIFLLWPFTPDNYRAFVRGQFGLESNNTSPASGRCSEIIVGDYPAGYVVCLKEWKDTPSWHGVLVHELMHLTLFLMQWESVPSTFDTHEHHCLTIESLHRRCLQLLHQSNQRKSKKP